MCPSNAMVKAPLNNKYGAKFYGTAAVNQSLFGNGSWQGRGCGKCYKLTGTSNVDTDRVTSTIILKATNLCPECAGDHYFDIAAPGFDTSSSGENHCKDSALDNNHGACSNWMGPKGSMNPSKDCDCNKIQDPTLRKGCENFLSLKWNNPYVQFEQVDCPPELGSKHPPCNTSGRWDIGLHGTCASSSPVVPKRELEGKEPDDATGKLKDTELANKTQQQREKRDRLLCPPYYISVSFCFVLFCFFLSK